MDKPGVWVLEDKLYFGRRRYLNIEQLLFLDEVCDWGLKPLTLFFFLLSCKDVLQSWFLGTYSNTFLL